MTPPSSISTTDKEETGSSEEDLWSSDETVPSIEVVINLNNEGVRLFEIEQTYEAQRFFDFCLEEIYALRLAVNRRMTEVKEEKAAKAAAGGEASDSSSMSSEERRDHLRELEEEKDSWFNPLQRWSRPLLSLVRNSIRQVEGSSAFVFSRAVFLQEVPAPPTHDNFLTMLEICISAILFNKAVINHIRALRHHQMGPQDISSLPLPPKDRRILMASIQKDYEDSFVALQQISEKIKAAEKRFVNIDILVLALFNNTGVLYLNELARYRPAAECFVAVSNLVRHLPGIVERILNDRDEVALLCMNAWMVPVTATSAA